MEIETYRQAWAERWAEETRRSVERTQRALSLLPELVRRLVDDYQATGVALIGSLARGDHRATSDIDLVVAGVAAGAFFKAGAALERAADMPVDLVPWETATEDMRDVVAREGKVLHGRL